MNETVLKVEGMTCNHCKAAVEGALTELEGVESAIVSLQDHRVDVIHNDHVSVKKMIEAIEEQGYDVNA
ncbi:MAG: copper chaperone CopZ [Exiguobacterium sp.]|uniref:Copper chaperone CopZ n=1 Tax=Exiguobacterium alkaliphilum TaxID=1428684 RepID=A0ABT2L2C0_9BACL|nr:MULTISPECIES: copper chaperone CopZ [Exiguobacterium]MDX5323769.1 copper chaperone CopZ [Exiguobacterium sp.]KDN58118.1 heavy metal transport/detoxification protein [Exiguobacterium sp. AB2]MCT4796141.1 copper chaperone CopZ [Exiguobacterium alkaliphilum]MDX5425577.1 copper chaperone CopZ [Exiguobacterium sp.]MDX6772986.1 copper chaperone CopZ [Exiguobacterium sp.]